MSDEKQPNVISLLTSQNSAEREDGLALASSVEAVTIDGSTIEDLAGTDILDKLTKLTSVTLTVGEHTVGHLAALVAHLQNKGVGAETIQVTGDFGGPEWLDARHYSWTKYFQVEEIEEYISECESGNGLQFTFGTFSLAPVANHAELSNILAQLPTGLSGDDISISRTNEGGSVYACQQSTLKTVQFFWEEMYEESSEFDCADWDQFMKFTKIISEAGLSLSQGFFYNDWSGTQVDQEDWWISEFDFPPAEAVTLNWAPAEVAQEP